MSLRPASAPPQRRRSYLDDVLAAGIERLSLGAADVGVRPQPPPQPQPTPQSKPKPKQKPRPKRVTPSTPSTEPTVEEPEQLKQYLDNILRVLQEDDEVEQVAREVLSGMNSTPDNADDTDRELGCREGSDAVGPFKDMIRSDPLDVSEDEGEETPAGRTAGGRKRSPDISHINIPEIEEWMREHTKDKYDDGPFPLNYSGLKDEWLERFPVLKQGTVFAEYTKKVRRKVIAEMKGGKKPGSRMTPATSKLLVQWVLEQQQEQAFTHLSQCQLQNLQRQFNLSQQQVQDWFCNMRARRPDLFPD